MNVKRLFTVIVTLILALSLAACSNSSESSQSSDTSKKESAEEEIVIYDDDTLKTTYLGVSEIEGVVVMNVRLENKTDNEITVLPTKSSVDGTMIQFTSGTLATIQDGKTFNQGWIIGSMPTENIEFAMSICDENMSELLQTDILTIEVK